MNKEFEVIKKDALKDILFEAGSSLLDAQHFEYSLKYLIYLLSKVESLGLDKDFCKRIIDDEEKLTCGRLIAFLKKKQKLRPNLEKALWTAITSRNLLIHNYFLINCERLADRTQHKLIEKEIKKNRGKIRSASKYLQPIIQSLAKNIDGIDLKEINEEIEFNFVYQFKNIEDT